MIFVCLTENDISFSKNRNTLSNPHSHTQPTARMITNVEGVRAKRLQSALSKTTLVGLAFVTIIIAGGVWVALGGISTDRSGYKFNFFSHPSKSNNTFYKFGQYFPKFGSTNIE